MEKKKNEVDGKKKLIYKLHSLLSTSSVRSNIRKERETKEEKEKNK